MSYDGEKAKLIAIASVFGWFIIVLILLLLGQTWHISGNENKDSLGKSVVRNAGKVHLFRLVDQSEPGMEFKDRLGAWDALRNCFSLFALAYSLLLIIAGMIAVAIALLIGGVVTANWDWIFWAGCLGLAAFLVVFIPLILWITLFFQEGTPAYFLIWLFGGGSSIAVGGRTNWLVLKDVKLMTLKN